MQLKREQKVGGSKVGEQQVGLKSWFHVAQATSACGGRGPYRNKIFTELGSFFKAFRYIVILIQKEEERKKGERVKKGGKEKKERGKENS